MNSDFALYLTQFIGVLAVIISLINLGIEIRKSRNEIKKRARARFFCSIKNLIPN